MNRRRLGVRALFALPLLFGAGMAHAQGTLTQVGPVTPGHGLMSTWGGAMDAGGAAGANLPGQAQSEIGLLVPPTPGSTAPWANSGTGPNHENACDYDGPATGPRHYICLSPNALGGPLLSMGATGGAAQLPGQALINGVLYPFPFTVGGIVGPNPSVSNDLAVWNNTSGTLLKGTATCTPPWAAGFTGAYDCARADVNGFPATSEFGGTPTSPVGNVAALVGAVSIPANAASTNNGAFGVAGYAATSAGTTNLTPAGVFGAGVVLAAGTPGTNAYTMIAQMGLNLGVAWPVGILLNVNCCAVAIEINPAGAAGTTINSMPMDFYSYNGTDSLVISELYTNAAGAFVVNSAEGALILQDNAVQDAIISATGSGLSLNAVTGGDFLQINGTTIASVTAGGMQVGPTSQLATTATGPFLSVTTTAGRPTGTPADASAGQAAVDVDTTDHKWCWQEAVNAAWFCVTGS